MKKKLVGMLLAAVLCVGLVACGEETANVAPEAEVEAAEEETTEEETAAVDESEEVTEEAVLEGSDEAKASNEENIEFAYGTVEDTTYSNEKLGIKANLGEDWYIANEEEKQQIFGLTTDALSNVDVIKYLEDGGVVIDFYAQNKKTAETINISVQKLEGLASMASATLNDQQYLDTLYEQMISTGTDQQIFNSLNISDGKMEKGETTYGNETVPCLFISGTMDLNGTAVPLYETQVYKRCYGVVAVITSASYNTNTSEEAFKLFE